MEEDEQMLDDDDSGPDPPRKPPNPLVERVDGLQSRSGCSSSGSAGQAQHGPARAQVGGLELGYVSLLQVQVPSRGGAVKHLVAGATGKQGSWWRQAWEIDGGVQSRCKWTKGLA